ncbi:PKD domain-containing protein [Sphingobacteriales bacterium UPWRP_1]|nr:PKD domain-containing protein [Sphingobacteriales bacterium UPWRP_1]
MPLPGYAKYAAFYYFVASIPLSCKIPVYMKLRFTLFSAMPACICLFLAANSVTASPELTYLQNKGQWPNPVLFKAKTAGQEIFTERTGFTFLFYNPEQADAAAHCDMQHNGSANPICEQHHHNRYYETYTGTIQIHAIKTRFSGANPNPQVIAQDVLPERHNFFLGNNPQKWASNIHPAKTLLYKELYKGIDMKVYSAGQRFKYDLLVAPHANAGSVELEYSGQTDLCAKNGHLYISTSVTEVTELSPYAYQIIDGKTVEVNCRYVVNGNRVRFAFPDGYNPGYALVIDPVLVASTYSGSTGTVYGHSATYGQNDEIFGSGRGFDNNYPATSGAYDVTFNGNTDATVSKYTADGTTLEFACYIGGSSGDLTANLITNNNNELILLISTSSSNFPVTAGCIDNTLGGGTDMGITVLSADGSSLVGSTYLGGSGEEGQAFTGWSGIQYGLLGELMVDDANNVYLATFTGSADFPVTPGAYQTTYGGGTWDGAVVKMNPNLSALIWSTYLGGTGQDLALGIRIANNGSVYVCGGTESTNFPVTTGAYQTTPLGSTSGGPFGGGSPDGYAAQLSANGANLLHSTFVNTNQSDIAFFIDLSNDENVCLYGLTEGNFPVSPGVYSNAGGRMLLVALEPDLSTLLYSTRIGTSTMTINPTAFLVDNCDRIYAGGFTGDSGLPTTPDAWSTTNGSGDFYFMVLEANAADLIYGTYFGSPDGWEHVDGGTCRYNDRGVVYQAVCTSSTAFPTTPTAYQATDANSSWDLVVFKFDFEQAGVLAEGVPSPSSIGCVPYTISFDNLSVDAVSYQWDFGDGTIISDELPTHTFTQAGTYEVMLVAQNPLSCNLADTAFINIVVVDPAAATAAFTYTQNTDCNIYAYNFNTELYGLTHFWNFGDFTTSTEQNPTHIYANPGTYEVMLVVSSTLGCFDPDTTYQTISFTADAVEAFTDNVVTQCAPYTIALTNNSINATSYLWNFDDGSPTSSEATPTHTFLNPGFYDIQLIASNPLSCNLADTAYVTLTVLPSTPLTANFTEIIPPACDDLTVQFSAVTAPNITGYEWDFGDGNTATGANVSHTYASVNSYTVSLIVSNPSGICVLSDTLTKEIALASGNLTEALLVQPENGCAPFTANFQAQDTGADSYLWQVGDAAGATVQGQNAGFTYTLPGTYNIALIATNAATCNVTDTAYATLEVYAQAAAGFTIPNAVMVGEPVQFTNTSTNATQFVWDFDDGQTSEEPNPVYIFTAVGEFNVCLEARNAEGCDDSICIPVIVLDNAKIGVPNAFTPNNDGINDVLYVEGVDNILNMEFKVYSRWGELLFITSNPQEGWDGFYRNLLQENEVYVYHLTATLLSGEQVNYTGNVTLLR